MILSLPCTMHTLPTCKYWFSDETAEQYDNWKAHSEYETVTSMVLEYYGEVHPEWKVGGSKIPLILDISCGAGHLSAILSEHCDKLIAIDISPNQVKLAQRLNSRDNIEYKVSCATAMSEHCPANAVDLMVVYTAAQYFDCDAFYGEVQKCLKPNGVLAILGHWNQGFQHEDERYRNCFSEFEIANAVDEMTLRSTRMLANSYRDLHFPFETGVRRELTLNREMTRKEIEDLYLGIQVIYTDGTSAVHKMVKRLPQQEKFTVIRNIFGIFYRFQS